METMEVGNKKPIYYLFATYVPSETFPHPICLLLAFGYNEDSLIEELHGHMDERETITIVHDYLNP